MGLIERPPTVLHADPARLVYTPHPVLLDGQQHIVAELRPGETLGPYLARTVPDWTGDGWEVRINGVLVPHEVMDRVRPKSGTLIEVRGIVGKQVLAIVAIAALTYFTFGIGTAGGAIAGMLGGGLAGSILAGAVFMAGSALINKVLMPRPKAAKAAEENPVYSINSARNSPRPYEPIPLLLGSYRITPDVASYPYSWYEGTDQIMGMVLCAGINVHSIEVLYNGDTLLSSYQGVQVYKRGFSGDADQDIPLYSNADTVAGGELPDNATWVQRTTSADTVRVQVNLEYLLGGQGTSGKNYAVSETVQAEYSPVGANTWTALVSRTFSNNNFDQKRATLSADVAKGQYDVRVRMLGTGNYTGHNTQKNDFTWSTMTCVQADPATYAGIARIGIRIKATGQLNGALDEVRGVAHSTPIPVWNGAAWVTETSSNPGAILLKYARGYFDEDDRIIAGIGLPDTQIDIPALQAFMVHCASNGYTYDNYIKDARSHEDLCNAIAAAGFGQITWAAGRFSVAWAADGQPLTATVNMATIKRASFQVDYTLANAADGIEYTYIDKTDWTSKTLRVAAPGVTTMLNPASVTGEGVGSEAQAAQLARYHLAQSLYQYKDITYSTDLEHLTYRRLSVLALQHDLTQWGHGGRVRAAEVAGGKVVVTLDEPVPAPPSGSAYIGLRIPGDNVYQVFTVQAFAGTSDTLTLVEAWPGGAPLPGDADDNPAHDTIWIYDFKATPGYRVRVVSVDPESDMQGARISVVPESPEFWTYVKTGEYTPPANQSLLPLRPVASGLTVTTFAAVQGDTIVTELQALWTVVGGRMEYADVFVTPHFDGELGDRVRVAETRAPDVRFRVPGPGTYTVTVQPYDSNGVAGTAATVVHVAALPTVPPLDVFDVLDVGGGLRKYTWAYDAATMQAPDFAGVEIRYVAGSTPTPDWDLMTPIGDTGFHAAAFESTLPPAGTWTFALRGRNTSGDLSSMTVRGKTLADNVGEMIGGALDAVDAETAARIQAVNDAFALADARSDALQAQINDVVGTADEWVDDAEYPLGDAVRHGGHLYRAKVDVPVNTPPPNPTYWEDIGNYSSVGEAVAAAVSMSTQNASDIATESTRVDGVVARMPAGTGELATSASVAAEASARADGDLANASALTSVKAQLGGGGNLLRTTEFSGTDSLAPWGTGAVDGEWIRSDSILQDSRVPYGMKAMAMYANGASPSGAYLQTYQDVPIEGGKAFIASAYILPYQARVNVSVAFIDSDGNGVGTPFDSGLAIDYVPSGNLSGYTRCSLMAEAPSNAVTLRFSIWVVKLLNAGSDAAAWIVRPQLEQSWPDQINPSPWVPGAAGLDSKYASATQALDARVTTTEAGITSYSASYTLTLDVNNYVTGFYSVNDGATSTFAVLAANFMLMSPGTAERVEYSNNNFRLYDSSGVLRMRWGVW